MNTSQWKIQAIDLFDLKCYNFNLVITIDNSYILSLSLSLSLWD